VLSPPSPVLGAISERFEQEFKILDGQEDESRTPINRSVGKKMGGNRRHLRMNAASTSGSTARATTTTALDAALVGGVKKLA
jgi:hypothetical protein